MLNSVTYEKRNTLTETIRYTSPSTDNKYSYLNYFYYNNIANKKVSLNIQTSFILALRTEKFTQ